MIRLVLIIIIILIFAIYSIFDAIICFVLSKINKNEVRTLNNKTIKVLLKIITIIAGVNVKIKGIENIDETKPLFVISNHRGFFDIVTGFNLLKKPCGFVAKNSFENVPFISYWMRKIDCLFLDRSDLRSGAKMVLNAINKINEGVSMWLCPEGTRNKNENPLDLLEFKSGAFKIAEKSGCQILPVAFYGTENVFEKQKPFVKSANVYINIGKMYSLDDLSSEQKLDIGKYNQELVYNLIKEIIDENLIIESKVKNS